MTVRPEAGNGPLAAADVGRAHALHDLHAAAKRLADIDSAAIVPTLAPDDAAYLRARVATLEGIAARLRASPGYAL